jgi:hypothetical protein
MLGTSPKAGNVVLFGHANPNRINSDFIHPVEDNIHDDLEIRIPFLYLNGDAHAFRHDKVFWGQSNFLRIHA